MLPIFLHRHVSMKENEIIGPVRVDRFPEFPLPNKTVAIHTHNFTGTVTVEASIELEPGEGDWVTVWTEEFMPVQIGAESTIRNRITNLTGFYIWMRCTVEKAEGAVGHVDRVTLI